MRDQITSLKNIIKYLCKKTTMLKAAYLVALVTIFVILQVFFSINFYSFIYGLIFGTDLLSKQINIIFSALVLGSLFLLCKLLFPISTLKQNIILSNI